MAQFRRTADVGPDVDLKNKTLSSVQKVGRKVRSTVAKLADSMLLASEAYGRWIDQRAAALAVKRRANEEKLNAYRKRIRARKLERRNRNGAGTSQQSSDDEESMEEPVDPWWQPYPPPSSDSSPDMDRGGSSSSPVV